MQLLLSPTKPDSHLVSRFMGSLQTGRFFFGFLRLSRVRADLGFCLEFFDYRNLLGTLLVWEH